MPGKPQKRFFEFCICGNLNLTETLISILFGVWYLQLLLVVSLVMYYFLCVIFIIKLLFHQSYKLEINLLIASAFSNIQITKPSYSLLQ